MHTALSALLSHAGKARGFLRALLSMKPFLLLATSHTPDGAELTLHSHDSNFFLRVNRQPLMGTNASESEKVLAELACARLGSGPANVLIGGLGFGFTLRRVLELMGPAAHVQVAELLPQVVAWNREFLQSVNGALLDDPRVRIHVRDVADLRDVLLDDTGAQRAISLPPGTARAEHVAELRATAAARLAEYAAANVGDGAGSAAGETGAFGTASASADASLARLSAAVSGAKLMAMEAADMAARTNQADALHGDTCPDPSLNCKCRFTIGHSLAMIEKTTVSR